jgi:hypothetical protein
MTKDFWKAAFIRAARTFLQVVLAVWTAGTLITQVDWKFLFLSALSAAIYSLLTSLLAGLPEVQLEQTLYDLDNWVDIGYDEGEDVDDEEDETDEEDDEEGDE